MYTLIDMHTMKNDQGVVFNYNTPMFDTYVDFCNNGGNPSVATPEMYEKIGGIYKGKVYYRLKLKTSSAAERQDNLVHNLYVQKGKVISSLCQTVINFITGRNDESATAAEVDAMITDYGTILSLLAVNRHTSAKALIDAITPDVHISAAELGYINSVYASHTAELEKISTQIVKAKA